jgi:predicted dehydrogenase
MEKLKVGIIGLGNIAKKVHLPYFHNSEFSEVVAVCSRNQEMTDTIGKEFGIQNTFSTIDKMLEMVKLDIVVICTPNALHYEATMKSLEAECHVFCEKPPAVSYIQAKVMAEKAKKVNKILSYNLSYRQKQESIILKQKINEGFFGEVYHINATFIRRRGIPGWGSFTDKSLQGGGALIDLGVHVLDLALHLLNYPNIESVLANTYNHIGKQGGTGLFGKWDASKFTVEDACFAHIKCANKISITLQTAFALHTKETKNVNLEIFGSKAGAKFSPLEFYTLENDKLKDTSFHFIDEVNEQKKSVETFLQTCLGKTTNNCTAAEGAALQQALEMIYES